MRFCFPEFAVSNIAKLNTLSAFVSTFLKTFSSQSHSQNLFKSFATHLSLLPQLFLKTIIYSQKHNFNLIFMKGSAGKKTPLLNDSSDWMFSIGLSINFKVQFTRYFPPHYKPKRGGIAFILKRGEQFQYVQLWPRPPHTHLVTI